MSEDENEFSEKEKEFLASLKDLANLVAQRCSNETELATSKTKLQEFSQLMLFVRRYDHQLAIHLVKSIIDIFNGILGVAHFHANGEVHRIEITSIDELEDLIKKNLSGEKLYVRKSDLTEDEKEKIRKAVKDNPNLGTQLRKLGVLR